MSITEDTIPEGKKTGLSPEDISVSSNEDQDNYLNEFSSLLTDEAEVSMQAETPLVKEKNDDSILEELEALYGSSSEVTTDDSESVDDVSVLDELDELYASSSESTGEDSEAVSNIEDSISENVSTGDSLLDEMEALLSGDAAEPVVNSMSDEVETSGAIENSSNEIDVSGMSALDELSELVGETETSTTEKISESSVSLDDVDEYLSSIEADYGASSNDETVVTDPVLDGLNEILSNSDDMDAEIPAADTEKSVLDEFASYMDGSSDLPGVSTMVQAEETAVEEVTAGETETESVFDEVDSTSDTLEQLEVMLNEVSDASDDEPGKTIQLNEDYSPIEQETPQLAANNEEEKHEDTSILENRIQPADEETEALIKNSLPKAKNNNRLPVVSMFLVAVAVIGFVVFWSLSGDQYSQSDRLQARQSSPLEKSVTVSSEAESLAQAEVKPEAPVLLENNANIDNLYASIDASRYEAEAYGSYEQPVQYNVDEPLNNEAFDSEAEMDVLPLEPDGNEENLSLVNEDVVETELPVNEGVVAVESSMLELQRTIENLEQLESVQPALSDSAEENTTHLSEQPVSDTEDKADNSWSVHLFAFRNNPPVSKFKFLEASGIPYEIKKTMLQGEVWYRVFVNTSSERSDAEEYAEMLKQKFAIKGIWLSQN